MRAVRLLAARLHGKAASVNRSKFEPLWRWWFLVFCGYRLGQGRFEAISSGNFRRVAIKVLFAIEQAIFDGVNSCLGPVPKAELAQNIGNVVLHCSLADY